MSRATAWQPLVPWIVASLLCAPLALSLLYFGSFASSAAARDETRKQLALLQNHAADPTDERELRRGVAYTSSGLGCAMFGPSRLPDGRIELAVLMIPDASLLDYRSLIDATISARPDFVVLQSTLLAKIEAYGPPVAWADARSFWRRQIVSWFPGVLLSDQERAKDARLPSGGDRLALCRLFSKPRGDKSTVLSRLERLLLPPADHRRREMRSILERFVNAGIPVLITTPPVNELSKDYYRKVGEAARATVSSSLAADEIYFLEAPELWPQTQFGDAIHMNPDRTDSYRTWLSGAIGAVMGD